MSRPTLTLLHGWAMTPQAWAPLTAALGDAFTVNAPSLPGHAGAAAVAPELRAWADAIASQLPDDGMLCAWSLGAMLALDIAVRHPRKVSRLVLIGATARFVSTADWPCALPADTVNAFRKGYAEACSATLKRFLGLQLLGEPARRTLQAELDAARQPHPDDAALPALVDGLELLANTDLRDHLAQVGQPCLLIQGRQDALMPVEAALRCAAALPHGRCEILESCGHAPLLSQPQRCAELIRAHAGV